MNSERGYKAALQEYGDADMIALSYVREALDWPVLKTEDASDHLYVVVSNLFIYYINKSIIS